MVEEQRRKFSIRINNKSILGVSFSHPSVSLAAPKHLSNPEFFPYPSFPPYLDGMSYIFSSNLARHLYSCALDTPFINIEDIFVTGLCANMNLRLRLTANNDKILRKRPLLR